MYGNEGVRVRVPDGPYLNRKVRGFPIEQTPRSTQVFFFLLARHSQSNRSSCPRDCFTVFLFNSLAIRTISPLIDSSRRFIVPEDTPPFQRAIFFPSRASTGQDLGD